MKITLLQIQDLNYLSPTNLSLTGRWKIQKIVGYHGETTTMYIEVEFYSPRNNGNENYNAMRMGYKHKTWISEQDLSYKVDYDIQGVINETSYTTT